MKADEWSFGAISTLSSRVVHCPVPRRGITEFKPIFIGAVHLPLNLTLVLIRLLFVLGLEAPFTPALAVAMLKNNQRFDRALPAIFCLEKVFLNLDECVVG